MRRSGYDVLEAPDGPEGVELYQAHRDEILLVLLDMTMPKMTGRETLLRIHEIDSNSKVVMMSGFTALEKGDTGDLPGLVGFLSKPIQMSQLNDFLEGV